MLENVRVEFLVKKETGGWGRNTQEHLAYSEVENDLAIREMRPKTDLAVAWGVI